LITPATIEDCLSTNNEEQGLAIGRALLLLNQEVQSAMSDMPISKRDIGVMSLPKIKTELLSSSTRVYNTILKTRYVLENRLFQKSVIEQITKLSDSIEEG
jgi:hypothetical protein